MLPKLSESKLVEGLLVSTLFSYFMPYTIVPATSLEPQHILIGFPFKFIEVYDLYAHNSFLRASSINLAILLLNAIIFTLLIKMIDFLVDKLNAFANKDENKK